MGSLHGIPPYCYTLGYHETKSSGKVFTIASCWDFCLEVEEWGLGFRWRLKHLPLTLCLLTVTVSSHTQVTSKTWGTVGITLRLVFPCPCSQGDSRRATYVVVKLQIDPEVLQLSRSSSALAWHGDGFVESRGWQLLEPLLPGDPGIYYSLSLGFLQSLAMKKCTHLTQPLYSRINLLTCVELLLLFPTDGAGTELHKHLGEGHIEGDRTWSNLTICQYVVAVFFWLTVLGEQQGYDLQSPRQEESLRLILTLPMVCVKLFQAVVWSLGDNPWLLNLGHHPALPRSLLPVFIGWCFQLSDWQEKRIGRNLKLRCSWQLNITVSSSGLLSCTEPLLLEMIPCDTMWFKTYCTASDTSLHIFCVAIHQRGSSINECAAEHKSIYKSYTQ